MADDDGISGGEPPQPLVWPPPDDASTADESPAAEAAGGNVGVIDAPGGPAAPEPPVPDPANLSQRGAPLYPTSTVPTTGTSPTGPGPLQTRRPPGYGHAPEVTGQQPSGAPIGFSGGGVSGYGTGAPSYGQGATYGQGANYGPGQPATRWGYTAGPGGPTYVPPPAAPTSQWGRPDPHNRQKSGPVTLLVLLVVFALFGGLGVYLYQNRSHSDYTKGDPSVTSPNKPALVDPIMGDPGNFQLAPVHPQPDQPDPVAVDQTPRHDETVGAVTFSVPDAYSDQAGAVTSDLAPIKDELASIPNASNVQAVAGAWGTDDQGVVALYASADGIDTSGLLSNQSFRERVANLQNIQGAQLSDGTLAGHPALFIDGRVGYSGGTAPVHLAVITNGNGFAVIAAYDTTSDFNTSTSAVFDSIRIN